MAVVVSVMAGLHSGSFVLKSMTGRPCKSKNKTLIWRQMGRKSGSHRELQNPFNPSAGSDWIKAHRSQKNPSNGSSSSRSPTCWLENDDLQDCHNISIESTSVRLQEELMEWLVSRWMSDVTSACTNVVKNTAYYSPAVMAVRGDVQEGIVLTVHKYVISDCGTRERKIKCQANA